ncbi:MAG: protein kinase [Rudaea sp.]
MDPDDGNCRYSSGSRLCASEAPEMDTRRWELAGDIFERMLDATHDRRPALLDSLCGDDRELRDVVSSMLAHGTSALPFAHGFDEVAVSETTETDPEPPTTHVGPWRLVKKIGSGGMGIVWLAERADGQFEQRVALKLIKRGMDSEAVLKRFLRERQILARLDHPNIAHLLDGGIGADGNPYFAMEHVVGRPLLRYCHERESKLEDRIGLFLDICSAVEFAHSQHVVHRDLKPSNMLVTDNASVKLLDFGIAKLLASDATDPETITHLQRERPMTPAYASPEQISGGVITEATDIYALGCVLYELLTGQRARDFSGAADVKDLLHIIESTDPVAPSRLKLVTAPVPPRRLRGDLDTIVLTALKRDPARRYPSVSAFAADLVSYLRGQPISARRDSIFYRGYKFARRHRIGIGALAAMAAVVVVAASLELRERAPAGPIAPGSSVAIVDFNNLSQSKDSAWLAPALAEMLGTQLAQGGKLHALPDELVRPARADLAAPLAGGYATKSLATLRKRLGTDYVLSGSYLVTGVGGDAGLHLDLALQDARNGTAIASIAESGALAELPALVEKAGSQLRAKSGFVPVGAIAEQQVDRALPPNTEVARRMGLALDALHKSDPARAKNELIEALVVAPGYAPAYALLAEAWHKLGYEAKALAAAEQAAAHSAGLPPQQQLRIARELAVQKGEWDTAVEMDRRMLALEARNLEVHLYLVEDLRRANKLDAAQAALDELRKLPASKGDPRVELKAVNIAENRGDVAAMAQHAKVALDLATTRDEKALAADAMYDLGKARRGQGRTDEAKALMQRAIAEYHGIGNLQFEADAIQMLGLIEAEQGQTDSAVRAYQDALSIYQRIGNRSRLFSIYANLANMQSQLGDRDAAEAAAKHAQEMVDESGDPKGQAWIAEFSATMKTDDAANDGTLQAWSRALALTERAGAREQHASVLQSYAEVLRLRGDLEGALKTCAQAQTEVAQLTDLLTSGIPDYWCAWIKLDLGDTQGATAGFKQAMTRAADITDTKTLAQTRIGLAEIAMRQGMWQTASEYLIQSIATSAQAEYVATEARAQSMLALCYERLRQPDNRDSAFARAQELRRRLTSRLDVLPVDIALLHLKGQLGEPAKAASELQTLADDAEHRHWLAPALEARMAALELMQAAHDPGATALRKRIEVQARQHGFTGVLARLQSLRPTRLNQPPA